MQETITQGTTPILSFTLSFEAAQIKSFFITFRQDDKNVLEKNLSDCTVTEYTVSVTLSQEETLLFKPNQSVQIQVRLTDNEENAFASPIFNLRVESVLKGGKI